MLMTEARQQADRVHLGEDALRPAGQQDDRGVEDAVDDVDAVERGAPVGRHQPFEVVAVRDALEQLARGHVRGVHRHDQDDAAEEPDQDAERHVADQRRVVRDEVALVGVEVDRRRQRQRRDSTGVTMPTVSARNQYALRDVAPALDQAGGLDHRLDARVGQHAARDADRDDRDRVGDAVVADRRRQTSWTLPHMIPGACGSMCRKPERDQVHEDERRGDEDAEGHAGVLADAEDVEAGHAPDDRQDEHV